MDKTMIATVRIQAALDNFIFAVRAAKHVIERSEMEIGFRHGTLFQYGDGDAAVQLYAWRNKRSIGVRQVKP